MVFGLDQWKLPDITINWYPSPFISDLQLRLPSRLVLVGEGEQALQLTHPEGHHHGHQGVLLRGVHDGVGKEQPSVNLRI